MTTAFSQKHNIDASDLIVLVMWNFSTDEVVIVPEAQFVKYLTTDTSKFYPVISTNYRTIDGDRFDGYAWFNHYSAHLVSDSSVSRLSAYLANTAKALSGYCFATREEDVDVLYSFVPVRVLDPALVKDLTIAHYTSPTPLSWLSDATVDGEESNCDPAVDQLDSAVKTRPMWLL